VLLCWAIVLPLLAVMQRQEDKWFRSSYLQMLAATVAVIAPLLYGHLNWIRADLTGGPDRDADPTPS